MSVHACIHKTFAHRVWFRQFMQLMIINVINSMYTFNYNSYLFTRTPTDGICMLELTVSAGEGANIISNVLLMTM